MRGEQGHVRNCACERCRFRRRATHLVIRSKDGRDVARVPWDGVSDKVQWQPTADAQARHWALVDAEGVKLASGSMDVAVKRADKYETTLAIANAVTVQFAVLPPEPKRSESKPVRIKLSGGVAIDPDRDQFLGERFSLACVRAQGELFRQKVPRTAVDLKLATRREITVALYRIGVGLTEEQIFDAVGVETYIGDGIAVVTVFLRLSGRYWAYRFNA